MIVDKHQSVEPISQALELRIQTERFNGLLLYDMIDITNISNVVKATKVLVLVLDAALKPVSSPELCDLAH